MLNERSAKILETYVKRASDQFVLIELSKATLGSYLKKSHTDAVSSSRLGGISVVHGTKILGPVAGAAHQRIVDKRKKGSLAAINKLTKESLNELSKATLSSYVKKAGDDLESNRKERDARNIRSMRAPETSSDRVGQRAVANHHNAIVNTRKKGLVTATKRSK